MRWNIKPYLDLCRISNLPTVWTNVLAAIVLSNVLFSWWDFFILSVSLSCFYTGGMCLNDLFDVKEDRINKPFRPLPSQKISLKKATLLTAVLFGFALFLLLFVPYQRAFYVGLILLLLIFVYDRIHKKHTASVFLMAACRLMIFVISAIAVSGRVSVAAWVGGLVQFIYVLFLSLVARYENHLKKGFSFPVIPIMLAFISLLDGIVMAFFVSQIWFLAGLGGAMLTHFGQKYIRGD